MLERVRGLRGQAALDDQFGLDQLRQRPLQRRRVERRYGLHQLIGEGAPDDRAQLRHQFCRCQAIQPRHQRIVQGSGNCQWRQGAHQLVAVLTFLEQVRLQHHFGQFFHEQRHAVSLAHDFLQHSWGEGFVARHMGGQARDLARGEPAQRERGEMRHHRPGRAKLWARGQHHTEPCTRPLLDEQTQQLQGGRINPMQVFHDHQHRLPPRLRSKPGQQGLQSLLALSLGRQGQGGIVRR
jgi:hypothetical protein